MKKHVNLIDLVKSFPTNIFSQNLASIQKRTSPIKFAHLAEKSGKGSISNLSTKVERPANDAAAEAPDIVVSLPDPGVDLCFDAYTQRLHVMSTANLHMESDSTYTSNRIEMSIQLLTSVSIQPRMSPPKIGKQ